MAPPKRARGAAAAAAVEAAKAEAEVLAMWTGRTVKDLRKILVEAKANPDGLKAELVDRVVALEKEGKLPKELPKPPAQEIANNAKDAEKDKEILKQLENEPKKKKARAEQDSNISSNESEDQEATSKEKGHKDPWLRAAGRASGHSYDAAWTPYFGDHKVLLDVFAWPALLINNNVKSGDLRSGSGLRSAVAEEMYQLWKQISQAGEHEAQQLLTCLEEIALCVDAHGNASCETFFTRHRARFLRAQNVTVGIETRLLRNVDPLLALQIAKRSTVSQLPLSAATLEMAAKAKLDLSKSQGANQQTPLATTKATENNERKCKYCQALVVGSFFKHFKACDAAKKSRKGVRN